MAEELKATCEVSMRHARRRAERMQEAQTSSLVSCASRVQEREDEHRTRREAKEELRASRSSSFGSRARTDMRNERLELVEDLERGPRPFEPRADDPDVQRYEPNARIALRTRLVPNAQMSEYLDCRYVVTPSMLYSLASRTGTSGSEYERKAGEAMDGDVEVPLYGDWVLFAVMGEKGQLKYTAATVDQDEEKKAQNDELTPFERSNPSLPARKYFGCKLLDLSTEIVEAHRHLPGHCMLNMMLFESKNQAGSKYSGGSGGAFEKLWKERDGMLLAILNPRIMKRRKNAKGPANELTITPRSADSILVIGQADAYAQCKSIKKDGSRCKAFVIRGKDNGVCDYHLEQAVAGRLRSRMEFASGYVILLM